MEKVIAALVLIVVLIGGYRFVQGRRKPAEQKPVEVMEITPTPIEETPQGFGEVTETSEREGQDLPSAGGSTEEKEKPSEEELEKMIKEFESDF